MKCYFFFKEQVQDTFTQAMCALLHQLFFLQPAMTCHAMAHYKANGANIVNDSSVLWTIPRDVIQVTDRKPITIILDALDECCSLDCKDLIRKLSKLFDLKSADYGKTKILLTSRPHEGIVYEMGELAESFPNLRIPG